MYEGFFSWTYAWCPVQEAPRAAQPNVAACSSFVPVLQSVLSKRGLSYGLAGTGRN